MSRTFCRHRVVAWSLVGLAVCSPVVRAGDKPIRKLTFDESAPVVELFAGVEAKLLRVSMSPKSAQESLVFIKNLTDEPLTVSVPQAVVGVHILPQFQGNGLGNIGQGNNLFNNTGNNANGQQNQGNQSGQSQSVGGQLQPMGNQGQGFLNQNNGNGNGNGNPLPGMNFFSIPPEKTVQLKLRSVCLDYGKPDPYPGLKYELRSAESAISNPNLRMLLEGYSPRVDGKAMQAAAWHLSNGLTWQQLATVPAIDAGVIVGGSMFSTATLRMAETLVDTAEDAIQQAEQAPPTAPAKLITTSARTK